MPHELTEEEYLECKRAYDRMLDELGIPKAYRTLTEGSVQYLLDWNNRILGIISRKRISKASWRRYVKQEVEGTGSGT